MHRYLAKKARQFERGCAAAETRKHQWDDFYGQAQVHFESTVVRCRKEQLFENLYVFPDPSERVNTAHFITLGWGAHPTGYPELNGSGNIAVERGCALHFAQDVRGMVICVLYPFRSPLLDRKEEYLIWKVFKSPAHIRPRHLRRATKLLFSYAHMTSCFGKPSLSDWCRMFWVRRKSWVFRLLYRQVAEIVKRFSGLELEESDK